MGAIRRYWGVAFLWVLAAAASELQHQPRAEGDSFVTTVTAAAIGGFLPPRGAGAFMNFYMPWCALPGRASRAGLGDVRCCLAPSSSCPSCARSATPSLLASSTSFLTAPFLPLSRFASQLAFLCLSYVRTQLPSPCCIFLAPPRPSSPGRPPTVPPHLSLKPSIPRTP